MADSYLSVSDAFLKRGSGGHKGTRELPRQTRTGSPGPSATMANVSELAARCIAVSPVSFCSLTLQLLPVRALVMATLPTSAAHIRALVPFSLCLSMLMPALLSKLHRLSTEDIAGAAALEARGALPSTAAARSVARTNSVSERSAQGYLTRTLTFTRLVPVSASVFV